METQDVLPLIKEYESMIETLTTQVEFYANEQENLRKEISTLINENKALGNTVNELLNSQSNTEKEIEQQRSENELLENLKKQLGLTIKEKDTVVQLWQNALKNIDHLEEELKLFEGRTHGYFSKVEVLKIKQKYEKQITEIEEQLIQTNLKLSTIKRNSSRNIENKNADLKKAVESQQKTGEFVKRLENEVVVLQDKLKEIMILRDELQNKLDVKNGFIEELKVQDFEAKAKVTEAVQIVEAAFMEKDAALLREAKAKEEVIKISKTLSEIMEEAAEKIKSEREKIKGECDIKIKEVQKLMKKLKEELNAKNIELEQCKRECKLLEEELERIRKGNINIDESNTSKLLILEKNLESTFQKLLVSERKKLQLISEKECIKADLEQMANCHQNDIKMREVEMQVLKHKIKTLQKQLKSSQSSLIVAAGKIDKMNSKIRMVYAELREKLKAKDTIYEEALKRTVQDIQNKNEKEHNKFQRLLELQLKMNKKWKKEVYDIIDKLEGRLLELTNLNKSLSQQLKEVEGENLKYKKSLEDICMNVVNVGNVKKDSKNTQ